MTRATPTGDSARAAGVAGEQVRVIGQHRIARFGDDLREVRKRGLMLSLFRQNAAQSQPRIDEARPCRKRAL